MNKKQTGKRNSEETQTKPYNSGNCQRLGRLGQRAKEEDPDLVIGWAFRS